MPSKPTDNYERLEEAFRAFNDNHGKMRDRYDDKHIALESRVSALEAHNKHLLEFMTNNKTRWQTLWNSLIVAAVASIFAAFWNFVIKRY